MARELRFAIPGDIEARTGGYVYDKRLIDGLRGLGWMVDHVALPASFPFAPATDRAAAAALIRKCPDDSLMMIDGLALGVLPEMAEAERDRLRLAALVHHPLALESGLGSADRLRFAESERRALAQVRAVVVTSDMTARTLVADYAVPANRITVAKPGCDPAPDRDRTRPAGAPVHLLAAGTVTPRKGHDVLIEALARIAHLPWTLTLAGSLDRAPDCAAALVAAIKDRDLGNRIALVGEVADMSPLYQAADLFVLASRYEGYGMVFAEALRHGLPVVGTTAGAIPEVVPAAAGILVSPDDPTALAAALADLIGNRERRTALAAGARAAGRCLNDWSRTAAIIAEALALLC